MESLNMSQLNLSSARASTSKDSTVKPEAITARHESTSSTDHDNEYRCEYIEDIWKILLEQEAEKPTIHLQSPQLEFRGALVQKLRDAAEKLNLSIATLHSAVALLDLFMDAHRLRSDRLTHVAFACLSLAAKSEEKFSQAPTLKILSKMSGIQLCGKTFRQLEWMIGQHAQWRLLAPTPVTFATLLTQYVVADTDLTTRHPKFVRRFKKDGEKLLEAYLDLSLSDYRLKVVESVDVGCACVAGARTDLGLCAWPPWLTSITGVKADTIAPITRLLQRMMQIMKSRATSVKSEVNSARTATNLTPCTTSIIKTAIVSTGTYLKVDTAYRQQQIPEQRDNAYSVLDLDDSNVTPAVNVQNYYNMPTAVDVACQRVDNPADYRYFRSSRLLEASLNSVQPSTSVAVKRGLETNVDMERKRYRLTTKMSQVVL